MKNKKSFYNVPSSIRERLHGIYLYLQLDSAAYQQPPMIGSHSESTFTVLMPDRLSVLPGWVPGIGDILRRAKTQSLFFITTIHCWRNFRLLRSSTSLKTCRRVYCILWSVDRDLVLDAPGAIKSFFQKNTIPADMRTLISEDQESISET
jgi:hypothetical protein